MSSKILSADARKKIARPSAHRCEFIFARLSRFVCPLAILFAFSAVRAQTNSVKITIDAATRRAKIEGACEGGCAERWTFTNSRAGVLNLAARVENLALYDAQNQKVNVRAIASGESLAARNASSFAYEMKLDAPSANDDAPHVSTLNEARGVLLLGDLLPRELQRDEMKIELALPVGWRAVSREQKIFDTQFLIKDCEDAALLVGRDLRVREFASGAMRVTFATAGAWAFADDDAAKMIDEIARSHAQIFNVAPTQNVLVMLLPFARDDAPANLWSAETRGVNVIFFSGRQPSKVAALAQLAYPLAHEIFHLWIPNALALTGDYEWFYEGFTLYEAARACVRLGYISFYDFLAGVSRAYAAYARAAASVGDASLVESSRRRWQGAESLVYNKGMLVAFLCDLALRRETNGRRSLEDWYRDLFARFRRGRAKVDANGALSASLSGGGAGAIVARFINGAERIDLARELAPFGLRFENGGVRVAETLTRAQRKILNELGYALPLSPTVRRAGAF